MPCSDVTEVFNAVVDDDDRLVSYRFVKRSCGKGVGANSLLAEIFVGKTVDEILAVVPEEFLDTYPPTEAIEEFLGLKHLIALQSVLEVLTGRASGSPAEICATAEVGYDNGLTMIDALIKVDLVTERIKSCGNCRGCGTSKKPKVVTFF